MALLGGQNARTWRCMDIVWQSCVVIQTFFIAIASTSANAPPSFDSFRFTSEPTDVIVPRGRPAMLNCAAHHDAGETPSMTWIHDGVIMNFEGEAGRRYMMENGSLYFSSVEHSRSHRPDEGEFQCVATVHGLGTIVSRKAALVVAYLAKAFDAEPTSLSLYLGDTAMFECHIDGAPEPEVRWFKDDAELDPANNDPNLVQHLDGVLEVMSVRFSDFGRYKCKVENVEKARISESVTLKQDGDVSSYEGVAPKFVLTPRDRVSLEGSIVVLNCGANGRDLKGKIPEITWLKEGATIDMIESDGRFSIVGQGSLRIDNVNEEDAGSYTCRAANSGESVDATASLTVHVPPRFQTRPQNIFARVKSEVELSCDVVGVPKPNIIWLKNGDLFIPSDYFQIIDGRNLRILGLLESDAGIYQCLAENDVGNIQASAQLIVLPEDFAVPSSLPPPSSPHNTGIASSSSLNSGGVNHNVPGEPSELQAPVVSQRFVTLSWRLPSMMGSSDLTYYSIYWMEEGSHRERMLNTSALEANIQHLKPNTRYHFRVLAHNSAGPSNSAAQVSVTTDAEVNVPGPPSGLRAHTLSPTSIQLEWQPPSITNGQITNYKLYYYVSGEKEEHDVNVEGVTYELMQLHKFREYNFRVVAYNNIGAGTTTQEVSAVTYSDTPDEAAANFTVETGSSTSLVARWMPPPEDKQNGLITGYKIRYKERKGAQRGDTIMTDGNIRSKEISNLPKGTEFQVRIQALTVNGTGPATEWQYAETYVHDLDETDVPGMPSSLRVRSMTTSIVASWTPPQEQGIMIRGYILGYGIGVPDVYKQVLDAKQRSHTIKNLTPSSSYVISLKAFNNVGEGRPTYETGETREEIEDELPTPMSPPVGLKAQVLSSTTILLTWSDNLLGRNQRITDNRFYMVRYNPKMSRRHKFINSTDLNVHIDDLKPNTEYEFSVKVLKGRRSSTWSLSVFNKTLEAPPATAPRDLTPVAVEGKPHWVTLNWQPPRQPNGQITGYLVFYTTDATQKDRDWVVDGTVGEKLSTTIKDLTPETTYYYKVQARNNKGYGPMSPTVIFRTPKADGTGGGRIELPDDYGRPTNTKGGRKESEESKGQTKPLVLWISIGCVCGVTLIAVIVAAVLLCKRNNNRQRKGYKPANKKQVTKPGPKDLKPPDLWMDHDQMELKNLDGGGGGGGGTTSIPMGEVYPHDDDGPGDRNYNPHQDDRYNNPHQDDRYQNTPFKPKPIMIPVDQPPPPREPIATAITNGHLTIGGPDTPPVIINPTPIRPMHPRAQYPPQYSNTPRVNAGDLSQPSTEDLSMSTLERRRKKPPAAAAATTGGDSDKQRRHQGTNAKLTAGYVCSLPSPDSPTYENSHAPIPYEALHHHHHPQQQQQPEEPPHQPGQLHHRGAGDHLLMRHAVTPPPVSSTPTSQAAAAMDGCKSLPHPRPGPNPATVPAGNGSATLHHLKSFAVPGPPCNNTNNSSTSHISAPNTPIPKHIVKPQGPAPSSQQQQQQQQQPSGPGKTRSPMPVIMPKAPDVVRSNKPDQEQDMPKSFSTEELSAEMANLEGLMKDLNAITQQEFEC